MWVGCLLLNRWAGARAPSPWSRRRRTPSDRARAGTGQPRHRHSCEPCPRRRPPAVTARSAASFDMALASPRPLIRLASGPPDDGHSRGAETKNPVMLLEGSCHCGAIRVRSARPYPFNLCYCNICRKTGGGGGHAINLGAEHESLEVEGEEHRSVYHAVMRGGRTASTSARRSGASAPAAAPRCGCGTRAGRTSCILSPPPSTPSSPPLPNART